MEKRAMIEKLSSLMKLDYDAAQAYETALKYIKDDDIHERISEYHDDHLRHVKSLEEAIRGLGGTPPPETTTIRGLFLEGAAVMQGITGTEGSLRALLTGERVTNKAYNDVLDLQFTPEIRSTIDLFYRDEQKHIRYITSAIDVRVWEHKKAA